MSISMFYVLTFVNVNTARTMVTRCVRVSGVSHPSVLSALFPRSPPARWRGWNLRGWKREGGVLCGHWVFVDISTEATALERGAVKRPPCPAKSRRQGHEGVRE